MGRCHQKLQSTDRHYQCHSPECQTRATQALGGSGVWAGERAAFLSLIPMHLFVSREEVSQHLGKRKQQADTMQSEKPNGCVAAKGQGPQGHGTFYSWGYQGAVVTPRHRGSWVGETLSGNVDEEAFLVFVFLSVPQFLHL